MFHVHTQLIIKMKTETPFVMQVEVFKGANAWHMVRPLQKRTLINNFYSQVATSFITCQSLCHHRRHRTKYIIPMYWFEPRSKAHVCMACRIKYYSHFKS